MSVAPEKELERMKERFHLVVDKEMQRIVDFCIKQKLELNIELFGEIFSLDLEDGVVYRPDHPYF